MNDLDPRLARAPHRADPQRDLWPEIEARLGSRPPRRQHAPVWMRAAAALALFVAGVVCGVAVDRRAVAPSPPDAAVDAEASSLPPALAAAATVQKEGSEFLAAVGRLRALAVDEELARGQGYEAALVVLATAAREVSDAGALPSADPALVAHARDARGGAAERVSRLVAGGEG